MWRNFLSFLAIGCVLASTAVFALLLRSYSTYDDVHYTFASNDRAVFRAFDLGSLNGHLFVSIITFRDKATGRETGFSVAAASGNGRLWSWPLATMGQFYEHGSVWQKFGVVVANNVATSDGTEAIHGIAMPHWFAALGVLILPAIRALNWLRGRKRVRTGCCTKCGYDLRASPQQCPECGELTPANRSRAT